MNPKYPWIEEMYYLAGENREYQALVEMVNAREEAYLAIREKLSPRERENLDSYIAACEELNYQLIFPAYRLGAQSTQI